MQIFPENAAFPIQDTITEIWADVEYCVSCTELCAPQGVVTERDFNLSKTKADNILITNINGYGSMSVLATECFALMW